MSTYIIRTYLINNTLDYSSSGSVLNRLKVFDIERTDSGVGSETSKSSKASVEIRRAPSLSKSSDSGSGKTLFNIEISSLAFKFYLKYVQKNISIKLLSSIKIRLSLMIPDQTL